MTQNRKIQLATEVDTTGARQGFEEVKAGARDMAQAVGQAGQAAGKGVESIGAGADGSAQKLDRATKSIIGSIQRTTAVMEAGERGSSKFYEALAKQRGVSPDVLRPYLEQLDAARRKQDAANESLNGMGMSARATAAALRGVPAQFTDIATSLASGQQPMTVLLQQGGQLKDMFGGIGPAARALGGYVAGLINPLTLAAAGAATLGVAFFQGAKESENLAKAITLTGNAAGTTVGQLNAMARRVAEATGATRGAGAAALEQLVATGRLAGEAMEAVAIAAVRMERATGQAVAETVKQFEELGKSPAEAAAKLNEQHHFLTAEIYRQIKALEDQGRSADAATLAQQAYADALGQRTADVIENLGALQTAWRGITDVAKEAWDTMLGIGRAEEPEDKVKSIAAEIAGLEANLARERGEGGANGRNAAFGGGALSRWMVGRWTGQLDAAREELAAAQEVVRLQQRTAEMAGARARQEQAGIEWMREGDKYLTKKLQMEREIARARQIGQQAGVAEAEIAERIARIRERYAEKKPSTDPFAGEREAAKAWEKTLLDLMKIQQDASGATEGWTKSQREINALIGSAAWDKLSAETKKVALQYYDVANAAELAAAKIKSGEALIAKAFGLDDQRDGMAEQAAGRRLSGVTRATYDRQTVDRKARPSEDLATRLENRAFEADESGNQALADRYFAAAGAAREYARALREAADENVRLAQEASLGQAFDDITAAVGRLDNSLGSAAAGFAQLLKAQTDFAGEKAAIDKAFAAGTKERYQAEMDLARRSAQAQAAGIANVASGLKGLFREHSRGYKAMEAAEKSFRVFELGMAVKNAAEQLGLITTVAMARSTANTQAIGEAGMVAGAEATAAMTGGTAKAAEAVANQAAKGDPYSAFPRMAMMAAAMAALGFVVAGGRGSGSTAAAERAAQQAAQGAGTVLGDPSAKSESIAKSFELLRDVDTMTMRYSAQMAASLRNIEANLRGFAQLVVRGMGGGLNVADSGWQLDFGGGLVGSAQKFFDNKLFERDFILQNDANKLVPKILGGLFGKTSSSVIDSGVDFSGVVGTSFSGSGWAQKLASMAGLFGQQVMPTVEDYINQIVALNEYAVIETTKKTWYSKKTSRSTQYAGLSDEVSRQVSAIFTGLADSVAAAAGALNLDEQATYERVLKSNPQLGRISLKGLSGEAAQQAVANVFSAAFDRIGAQVMPELLDFQRVGEGYYQTIMRVAAGYEQADTVLGNLGIELIAFGDVFDKLAEDIGGEFVRDSILAHEAMTGVGEGISEIVAAASGSASELADIYRQLDTVRAAVGSLDFDPAGLGITMIRGAGGLTNLADGLAAYQESFLSDTERLNAQQRQVAHEFGRLGLTLPDSKDAFRAMVEALDLASESGQLAFGRLMQLAPLYADLADEQLRVQEELRDGWQRTADSIIETMRRLRGDLLGTGERGFAAAQADFAIATAAARAGDQKAADRLPELAQAVVDLGKTVATSSTEQALITARTLASLSATVQGLTRFGVELPQFDAGANYLPYDMTARVHEGERIIPAADNRELMRRLAEGPSQVDLAPLISEVRELRAEVRAVAGHTAKTARSMERFDDGDALKTRVVG